MIEIGKTKIIAIRKKGKIVRSADGVPETKLIEAVVQRVTRNEYGHNSRYSRRLIVRLHSVDMLTIRPTGLRTEALIVSVNIGKIYKDLLAHRAMREGLEKARQTKAKLKEKRAMRNLAAAERRFKIKIKDAA